MRGLVHTSEGLKFISDKRTYNLYEGMCIDADRENLSSDIIFIMDDNDIENKTTYIGYIYGADFLKHPSYIEEYERYIRYIIERYEQRHNMPNGIARLEHARKIVDAYLTVNEEVMREMDDDVYDIEEIKKDLDYLKVLIEKAKEMQR